MQFYLTFVLFSDLWLYQYVLRLCSAEQQAALRRLQGLATHRDLTVLRQNCDCSFGDLELAMAVVSEMNRMPRKLVLDTC